MRSAGWLLSLERDRPPGSPADASDSAGALAGPARRAARVVQGRRFAFPRCLYRSIQLVEVWHRSLPDRAPIDPWSGAAVAYLAWGVCVRRFQSSGGSVRCKDRVLDRLPALALSLWLHGDV